jgi:hypothetical protein
MNEVKELTDNVEVTVKGFEVEGFILLSLPFREKIEWNDEISRQRYKGGHEL